MREIITIYTTCSDKKEAKKIGEYLVKKNLVACANYFPVDSIYEWRGEIKNGKEVALFLKTFANLYDRVEEEIIKRHSYEAPVILATKVERINKSYLEWMREVIVDSY